MGSNVKAGLRRLRFALSAIALFSLSADPALSQQAAFVPAATARDNIGITIRNIRLLRGAPEGTLACKGSRAGARPSIRCEVRYVDNIAVTGIEINELDNPANIWTASFRPLLNEEDESAYLLLIDRSNAARAPAIRRAAQDLAELFQVTPKQRIAVAAYDSKLEILQDFTADGKSVAAALDRVRPGNETAELYRLALEAVRKLAQTDAPRKVLVIASDGKFDDTVYNHMQVAQEANRLNVRIVTIGYHDKPTDVRDLQSLRRLSAETRGFFFETPGGQRGITPRGRNEFLARLNAGVVLEAEALARGVPRALHISLRHPQGAATSFTVELHPGAALPGNENNPTTPMDGGNFFQRTIAWLADDLTRAAAIFAGIAVVLFGLLVSGFVWRSSRRGKAAAPVALEPAQSSTNGDHTPPTRAKPAALLPPAPPTEIEAKNAFAWLEFNGSPGTVPVYKDRISIGRERDNDVVTDPKELSVSRHHVSIERLADGSFQIVNRSAAYRSEPNPVLINGASRESARIADGDVIKLGTGNYGFLFRDARKSGH